MKKMLRARTWVIIPLIFLLILQVFSPFSVAAVLGEEDSSSKDTANIQFSLDGETNQELYPIKGYMAKVSLNTSGDGAVFKDTTVTLEINHDMINEITIDLPSRAKEIKFYKHDNKAYFDIIFEEIRGGEDFSFDVPIYIDRSSATFPEGYETQISGTLSTKVGENETIELEANRVLSFKTKYGRHRIIKMTNGRADDGAPVYGGEWNGTAFDPASIVQYTFDLEYNQSGTSYSNQFRSYNEIEIIDTLPDTAVFDEDLNPGWELIDDGKKVRYILTSDSGLNRRWFEEKIKNLKLNLTFPNMVIGEYVENKVKVIFKQTDRLENEKKFGGHVEPDHTICANINNMIDSAVHGIADKKAGSRYGKGTKEYDQFREIKDMLGDKRDKHTWYYNFTNLYGGVIKEFEAIDLKDGQKSLDQRMRFVSLDLSEEKSNVEKVIVYNENGEMEKELDYEASGQYDLGDNAHGFKVILKEVRATESIRFTADSVFIDPESISYNFEEVDENRFKNVVEYKGEIDYGNGNKKSFSIESEATFLLVSNPEKIKITKATNSRNRVFNSGDIVSFHIRIYYRHLDLDRSFNNLKVVDLLPLGLDPLEPDYEGEGTMNSIKTLQKNRTYHYDIVENYQNSGRIAYVFNLEGKTVKELIDLYPQVGGSDTDPFINIPVQFRVNRQSNIASNRKNEVFFLYDGEQLDIVTEESKKENPFYDANNKNSVKIVPGGDNDYLFDMIFSS